MAWLYSYEWSSQYTYTSWFISACTITSLTRLNPVSSVFIDLSRSNWSELISSVIYVSSLMCADSAAVSNVWRWAMKAVKMMMIWEMYVYTVCTGVLSVIYKWREVLSVDDIWSYFTDRYDRFMLLQSSTYRNRMRVWWLSVGVC